MLVARTMPNFTPTIIALWHGQHLLTPFYYPRGEPLVAMVSRSADAELNALVIEKIGFEAVRGSGGRDSTQASRQGRRTRPDRPEKGARRRQERRHDRRHSAWHAARGRPWHRYAGAAVRAGRSCRWRWRPAAARCSRRAGTRRRSTCRSAGRRWSSASRCIVPADADEADMERKRRELTASLNEATERAYRPGGRRTMSERWARTILYGLSLDRRGGLSVHRHLCRLAHRQGQGRPQPPPRALRHCRQARARPGPLIWMHAASVGETNAVVPLIERILECGVNVVLTTGTVTSAQVAEARLGAASSTNMCRSTSSRRSAISSTTGSRTWPSSPNPRSGR